MGKVVFLWESKVKASKGFSACRVQPHGRSIEILRTPIGLNLIPLLWNGDGRTYFFTRLCLPVSNVQNISL